MLMFLYGMSAQAQVNPEPLVVDFKGTVFSKDSSLVVIPALINFNFIEMEVDSVVVSYQLCEGYTPYEVYNSGSVVVRTESKYNSQPFSIFMEEGVPNNTILKTTVLFDGKMLYQSIAPIPWVSQEE